MEVSRWLRTSLPLAAICARLEAEFGWPAFVIDAGVARLTVDDLRLELKWVPFDPRRELWGNLMATLAADGRDFERRWDAALDALCEPAPRYRFEDHYYLRSLLGLDAFAAALQQTFQLPELHHDCENENEWCMVETDDVVVHVSHAYRTGHLPRVAAQALPTAVQLLDRDQGQGGGARRTRPGVARRLARALDRGAAGARARAGAHRRGVAPPTSIPGPVIITERPGRRYRSTTPPSVLEQRHR